MLVLMNYPLLAFSKSGRKAARQGGPALPPASPLWKAGVAIGMSQSAATLHKKSGPLGRSC